jgi:hypothetical protein
MAQRTTEGITMTAVVKGGHLGMRIQKGKITKSALPASTCFFL